MIKKLFLPLLLIFLCALKPRSEAWYVEMNCFGQMEYKIGDIRIDCLTDDYAIEYDFANKWYEGVTQARYYADLTNRRARLILIKKKLSDQKFIDRARRFVKRHNLHVDVVSIR